jgi:hypothetical protein
MATCAIVTGTLKNVCGIGDTVGLGPNTFILRHESIDKVASLVTSDGVTLRSIVAKVGSDKGWGIDNLGKFISATGSEYTRGKTAGNWKQMVTIGMTTVDKDVRAFINGSANNMSRYIMVIETLSPVSPFIVFGWKYGLTLESTPGLDGLELSDGYNGTLVFSTREEDSEPGMGMIANFQDPSAINYATTLAALNALVVRSA